MKLAILSRNRQLHSIRRLLKEARSQRVQCEVFDPLDCQIVVSRDSSRILVHDRLAVDIDVAIPRIGTSITDYGLAVVKQFELLGIKMVNSSLGIAQSRDKLRCLQVLAEKGFDIPTTILMRGSRGIKMGLRHVHGTPAVLKLIQGTQGVGVMLVESPASAESVIDTMWGLGQDVILQQYIAESRGQDIRALVIGNEVVAAMRRQARPGEFRSNIHRGGEGIPTDLNPHYRRIAVTAVKALGLSVAGVDILESLNGPKIIEVNSSPGFEGIEAATGLNVARMMIQFAIELGRGRRGRQKTKPRPAKKRRSGRSRGHAPKSRR
ncbi:MAG: RimK family alpha-L-glutamate ligase [Deltaproteobacteria bacterium]|nr:RimK family alpha-L-glutamate ligase [Deltaproteobacteria bacterium]